MVNAALTDSRRLRRSERCALCLRLVWHHISGHSWAFVPALHRNHFGPHLLPLLIPLNLRDGAALARTRGRTGVTARGLVECHFRAGVSAGRRRCDRWHSPKTPKPGAGDWGLGPATVVDVALAPTIGTWLTGSCGVAQMIWETLPEGPRQISRIWLVLS